jgi:exodeoxyribonuclease VII large subunit
MAGVQRLIDPAPPRRLSLARLASAISGSLASLGRVEVEGEVVAPRLAPSGHLRFTLRDRAAQVRVLCRPRWARHCQVAHGERVAVVGRVCYRPARGALELEAEQARPVGAGALAARLEQARARLAAEGLLDRPRLPLPRLPRAVGVVCGGQAAVRADIEAVAAARYPGLPLVVEEVAVTGVPAAEAVAAALGRLDAMEEVEVIVLARGGGDPGELLAFSDEELCRAVARSLTPVVSAIGHEGDRPLCDEVADARFATPSLAAAAVVPDRRALEDQLDSLLASARDALAQAEAGARRRLGSVELSGAAGSALAWAGARLERAAGELARLDLVGRVLGEARRLGQLGWEAALPARLDAEEAALAGHARVVEALAPARVLERGYAVVRGSRGQVLRSPDQARVGEELELELARGRLSAVAAGPRPR